MNKLLKSGDRRGFTLIEIIAVLMLVGVLMVIVISSVMSTSSTERIAQESVIKNHIRFAQAAAMKQGEINNQGVTIQEKIWGMKCDGTYYWMFVTNDPDTAANHRTLPGEENVRVELAEKKITMNAFTVFFDAYGRPYTAYTEAANTPVSAANPLLITVDSVPTTGAVTFGITPETGFMQ